MRKFNKKGFTLVELIVVIAIVGVLAAILIPTLMGYVNSSQVTSADRLAADIRKNVGYFLTSADTSGYGMLSAKSLHTEVEIVVDDFEWKVTVADTTVFADKNYSWVGSGSATADTPSADLTCAENLFCKNLANLFPEISDAYIEMILYNGSCMALYITTESNTAVTMLPFADNGWSAEEYNWNNQSEGVCEEGFIVGTSPKLPFKA